MDLQGKYLIVWIYDQAARLFLGLTGKRPKSRWAVWGLCKGDSDGHLWMEIDKIEERRPVNKKTQFVSWTVKPNICSVNWSWIITAQLAGESMPNPKEIGFTSHTAKS